jgi:hypothetical protein
VPEYMLRPTNFAFSAWFHAGCGIGGIQVKSGFSLRPLVLFTSYFTRCMLDVGRVIYNFFVDFIEVF